LNQESILQLPVELPGDKEISVKDVIPDIISGNTEYMISVAMKIGFYLTRELPKKERLYLYQIRRIFGMLKRLQIEGFDGKKLLLLKPHLAFIASKNDSALGIQYLKDVMIESINQVGEDENRFRHFIYFFESIIAYHQEAEKGNL